MSFLVIGKDSDIGNFFYKQIKKKRLQVFGTSRKLENLSNNVFFYDLSNPEKLEVDLKNIDICFIFVGKTSIEFNNKNMEEAHYLNYICTTKLIDYLLKFSHLKIIFFSTNLTNLFFDKNRNIDIKYNFYAYLKYKIEEKYFKKICIIKLSKTLTQNFYLFESWINLLKEGKEISPYHNVFFSPIHVTRLFNELYKNLPILKNFTYSLCPIDQISYLSAAEFFAKKLKTKKEFIKSSASNNISYNPLLNNYKNFENFTSIVSIEEYFNFRNYDK